MVRRVGVALWTLDSRFARAETAGKGGCERECDDTGWESETKLEKDRKMMLGQIWLTVDESEVDDLPLDSEDNSGRESVELLLDQRPHRSPDHLLDLGASDGLVDAPSGDHCVLLGRHLATIDLCSLVAAAHFAILDR